MNKRFIEYYGRIVNVVATGSHARRLQVGALLVDKSNRIRSTGYNGLLAGGENNCEIEPPDWDGSIATLKTKSEVIHAEDNCLRYADGNTQECSMFITHAPCVSCAMKIQQAGIFEVFYVNQYRDTDGIDFLEDNGIPTRQIENS